MPIFSILSLTAHGLSIMTLGMKFIALNPTFAEENEPAETMNKRKKRGREFSVSHGVLRYLAL